MLKWLTCLLTFGAAQVKGDAPFWQAKPKFYERICNREILVNVVSVKPAPAPYRHQLRTTGGGQVSAPCSYAFTMTSRLNELAQASDYIHKSEYDAKTHMLSLELEALQHKADLKIELNPQPDGPTPVLGYKIVSGPMQGFAGELKFFTKGKKCDVGFSGLYAYDTFPIAKMFLEFGLEVVFQRLAFRSRQYVEHQWNESKKE